MQPKPTQLVSLALLLTLLLLSACSQVSPAPAVLEPQANVLIVNSLQDPGEGVCTIDHCTLREAIDAAASGDTIQFNLPENQKTIYLDSQLEIRAKSITIEGPESGNVIIDGQDKTRLFEVTGGPAGGGASLTLENLTLTKGSAERGGAIWVNANLDVGASLTIINSTIVDNEAVRTGGGIYGNGTLNIINSTISESKAGIGGGIYNFGSLTISNSTISWNYAESLGGGIYSSGVANITNSTISKNTARSGGGLYINNSANAEIMTSAFSGNSAVDGGGIYNNGTLTMTNSTISGNEAPDGGGIYNRGSLTITKSTISGNKATAGGGVLNSESAAIISSTVSGNTALYGGGFHNGSFAASLVIRSSTVTLNGANPLFGAAGVNNDAPENVSVSNTIIAGNQGWDCAGVPSDGYNLVVSGGGCLSNRPGDIVVQSALVFTHVLEQELKDNGGPTKMHALIERGLAVDAGYCPGETEDQRGFARPVDISGITNARDGCDIGAFEWQGPTVAPKNRADLIVSLATNKTSVRQGDLLTYYVRVQNLGPQTAPDVLVNSLLSSGVTFVSVRADKGTFTGPPVGETGTVSWYLSEMDSGANEVSELVVTVRVRGKTTITLTSTVTGDVTDPNPANDSTSITVSVAAGGGGGKK